MWSVLKRCCLLKKIPDETIEFLVAERKYIEDFILITCNSLLQCFLDITVYYVEQRSKVVITRAVSSEQIYDYYL